MARHEWLTAALPVVLGLATLTTVWAIKDAVINEVAAPAQADVGAQACHNLIDHFAAYPVVDLSDEFEGLPLTYCRHVQTAPTDYGIPATDYMVLVYGDCTPVADDDGSCPAPLQITIDPACGPVPAGVRDLPAIPARGLQAHAISNGHLYAEAPGYKVTVSVNFGPPDLRDATAMRAMGALRGANPAAAGITASGSLAGRETGAGSLAAGGC